MTYFDPHAAQIYRQNSYVTASGFITGLIAWILLPSGTVWIIATIYNRMAT